MLVGEEGFKDSPSPHPGTPGFEGPREKLKSQSCTKKGVGWHSNPRPLESLNPFPSLCVEVAVVSAKADSG